MVYSIQPNKKKKGFSVAEISVFIIVVGILCASVIPAFVRIWAYKRNTARITDIKTITQQVKTYQTKEGYYPATLRDIEGDGLGKVPKDPSGKVYCTGAPRYTTGDYQYYSCSNCEAVGPFKTFSMTDLVQVGALMEWENKRGERNSGNRWAKYGEGERSDCAANAVWGAGILLEGGKGNWVGGTGSSIVNIPTNSAQSDYEPRYNVIITSDTK